MEFHFISHLASKLLIKFHWFPICSLWQQTAYKSKGSVEKPGERKEKIFEKTISLKEDGCHIWGETAWSKSCCIDSSWGLLLCLSLMSISAFNSKLQTNQHLPCGLYWWLVLLITSVIQFCFQLESVSWDLANFESFLASFSQLLKDKLIDSATTAAVKTICWKVTICIYEIWNPVLETWQFFKDLEKKISNFRKNKKRIFFQF